MNNSILIFLSLLVAITFTNCQESEPEELPNIILLIGDDHGFPYFGFMGADYVQTPNLDQIAQEGYTFRIGHVTDNHCRPSLQTLMTGYYPRQYNLWVNRYMNQAIEKNPDYENLSAEEQQQWRIEFGHHSMQYFTTLPELLAEKGYVSFQGGKWWEQSFKNGGFTDGMSKGWDMSERGTNQWFHEFMGGEGMALGRETIQPVYDFIDKNKDKPFFIWYGPSLPHTPLNPPDKYLNLYQNENMSESAKEYYGNCTWFDDGVGDLMAYIDKKGLSDNTMFIYVNDNGWEQGPQDEYKGNHILYSNGGPRGKLSLYEMAFRTPIIFYLPGKIIAKMNANDLVSSTDIVPTILDYAGIKSPEDIPGLSLRPVLEGNAEAVSRNHLIGEITQHRSENDVMGRNVEGYYVRTVDWHFMWYVTDNKVALYNMKADPLSDHNVVNEHPDLVEKFKMDIETWKKKTIASQM